MKMWKKVLTAFLAVALVLTPTFGSEAAETSKKPYKVTISAGNHGKFADGTDKLSVDAFAGTVFGFDSKNVILNADENGNPSKYYVRGVRLSGRDDAEIHQTLSLKVEHDADYVVVYGIKGNQVAYTVEYKDANGKKLAESDTFYGNVGDKPVVACKYIDGYAPQAFALTGTLRADAENKFTFIYSPSTLSYFNNITEYVDGGTEVIYVNGGTVVIPGAATGGATNVTGGGAAGGAAGETAEQGGNAEGAGGQGQTEELPPEIIDLDDEETPLANIDLEGAEEALPMAGIVAIGVVSLAAIIALIAFLIAKKRKTGVE